VWDSVNAQLLAANGDHTTAVSTINAAQTVIDQRFGEGGFYSLLAKRRAQSIAKARKGQS
jgi:hypothetical protein